MTNNWSPVFGERRYRANRILKEFCYFYYREDYYNKLLELEEFIKENITKEINAYVKYQHDGGYEIYGDYGSIIEGFIGDKILKTPREPNGKNKFPDYKINGICFDSKAVMWDNYSYNNSCGSIQEISKHIIDHLNGDNNEFYKSFIIFTYYTSNGEILDVKIMPMISAIYVTHKDWKPETMKFVIKSAGDNVSGPKNTNVTLKLPSFLKKNGYLYSIEEQELLIMTATYNYLIEQNGITM